MWDLVSFSDMNADNPDKLFEETGYTGADQWFIAAYRL